jgi:hypothetical protein
MLHFEKSVEPVLSLITGITHVMLCSLHFYSRHSFNTDDVGVCIASNFIITLNVNRFYTISRYLKQIGTDRVTLDFENNIIQK